MANRSAETGHGANQITQIHRRQRWMGWLVAPIWVPLAAFWLSRRLAYRVHDLVKIRQTYRELRQESNAPLLVCANHLTLIDSFLIALALSGSFRYLVDFDSLPWNVPEESNFANTSLNRILAYLGKCVPIRRGGTREDVAYVLNRVIYLLQRGEVALVFPEGGRSRVGRIEATGAGWGVGRIVSAVEGCRVLCVYMRGEHQETYSDWPIDGERFHVSLACIEPKSESRGVRGTRDLSNQIISKLSELEAEYFSRRKVNPSTPETTKPGAKGDLV
ncbi:MAG: hypothetical protein CL917_13670 [Deltaproteobacteria bacterium]|nr:hypothetical protein [Deltaproteobacteria bacterium]